MWTVTPSREIRRVVTMEGGIVRRRCLQPRRAPTICLRAAVTSARIHVLVYDDLTAALLDWDDLDAAWASGTMPLVDAALVETAEHTVRTLHRFSTRCAAHGFGVGVGRRVAAAFVPRERSHRRRCR